jgi:glutamyl/glutaminyl-tRNA synthetase
VDDDLLGVTLAVRGEDLRESTEFQRRLSGLLPGDPFAQVRVLHHPLINGPDGHKLSKSVGGGARPMVVDHELREHVRDIARNIAADPDRLTQ